MIPNVTYGGNMGGLQVYLAGPGRENEHAEQHLVAGDPAIMAMHGESVLDRNEALAIARELDEYKNFFGVEVTRQVKLTDPETGKVTGTARTEADVWHCSLSLSAEEGQLSDEQWGRIATDFVDRMGFAGESSGKADCRWVAVRHGLSKNGNDHIHIAVSIVRADGTKAHVPFDKKLTQKVCRELERDYGLQPLHAPERTLGERGVQPGERESAKRRGAVEVDAQRLERTVRAAAVSSVDEGEFVRRMRQAGVPIRPRFAAGRDDVVAGYSVALRPEKGQPVVWHGGGRLARDLTLPELRKGWPDRPETATAAVQEWRATAKNPWCYEPVAPGREMTQPSPELWDRYTRELGALRERLRSVPVSDRDSWARAAREASGAFAAWSQRVEATPGPLADASRILARSAHLRAHETKARPVSWSSAAGNAMVLMQVARTDNPTVAQAMLLRELVKLASTLNAMHTAAGDAKRAAQLRAVMTDRLASVYERMPAIPAPTAAASTLTAEQLRVQKRAAVDRGWADGSPVPHTPTKTTPDRASTLPPAAPERGRGDDRGR